MKKYTLVLAVSAFVFGLFAFNANNVAYADNIPAIIPMMSTLNGNIATVDFPETTISSGTDWMGVFLENGDDHSYISWINTTTDCPQKTVLNKSNGTYVQGRSCTFKMDLPGTYNFRLFYKGGYTKLAVSNSVTTASVALVNMIAPTTAASGDTVAVDFPNTNVSSSTDWIGVFPVNGDDHSYTSWINASNCTDKLVLKKEDSTYVQGKSCLFKLELAAGTYNFRLFYNGGYIKLAESNPITVAALPIIPMTATLNGNTITVDFPDTAISSATDWIGVYTENASDATHLNWISTSTCSQKLVLNKLNNTYIQGKSCTLNIDAPGTYNLRLFFKGGYTKLGQSNSIIVAQ